MKKKESIEFGKIGWVFLGLAFTLIIFSFIAPSLFTSSSTNYDFTTTGEIGDTIGGIMNPFIAIAGVLLTFLAFYIQVKANKQQRDLFRQELDSNKFENQFYEMLRLHKENVNEINLNLSYTFYVAKDSFIHNEQIRGRETFKYLLEEITIIYFVIKQVKPDLSSESIIKSAYDIFYHGRDIINPRKILKYKNTKEKEIYKNLNSIDVTNSVNRQNGDVYKFYDEVSIYSNHRPTMLLNYDLFQGHSALIAHYFRHLYQMVKFIVEQDEQFVPYKNKRNYLRILRSQLSNQEQALIFYNWKSKFGQNWENNEKKYFTDYRMIHNLYNDILIEDFKLEEEFDVNGNYKKEEKRKKDPLFEFQDW